jgi:putative redox protein
VTVVDTIPGVEVKSTNRVHVTWAGGQRFDGGRPGGPVHRIDGDAVTGPSPVDTLLNALAACTSIDVVEILAKRRTPVRTLTVDVEGARAVATPSRLVGVLLTFRIAGEGIERLHAERAIELSVTKYCSVRDSLDPNLPVRWVLELEP